MHHFSSCNDRRARLWAAALLVGIALLATLASRAGDAASRQGAGLENPRRAGQALIPRQGGMRVYLDNEGRPIVPPAALPESAVAPRGSRATTSEAEPSGAMDAPGGGKIVILGGRFQSYSSARIAADGTLSVECRRSRESPHAHAGHNEAYLNGHPDRSDRDDLPRRQGREEAPSNAAEPHGGTREPASTVDATRRAQHQPQPVSRGASRPGSTVDATVGGLP